MLKFIPINTNSPTPALFGLLAASLALLVSLAIPSPAMAGGPPPDYACRGCHVDKTDEWPLSSGETILLGVDIKALAQSVHGAQAEEAIYCTDCHRSRDRYLYPHQANPAQNRQEFAADVAQNCSRCHDSLEKHNPGHLAAKDSANLPTCTNCHTGGHAMEPATTLAAEPVATCQNCHQTYDDPKVEVVHQDIAANLTAGQTCQNCHNNEPLYPADKQCKACHGLLESEMTLASGDAISLHVEADTVYSSVHGRHQIEDHQYTALLCTDCHRDQARYDFPHQPVTPSDARHFTLEMSGLCQECHQNIYERQQDSTHAAAMAEGKIEAATCVDCHGSHEIQIPDEPREQISLTCGQCHTTINEEYASSVHGAALLGEDNPDVPVCIDCHGVHNISDPTTAGFRTESPLLCAECHADEELMAKYDISPNVFETYVADFHGTTLQLFEPDPDTPPRQAVCFDCHGVHSIHAIDDPEAGLGIKENLLVACRQCHKEATLNFPDAWLAHYEPSPEKAWGVYYTETFFVMLTSVVLIGLISHIGLDFLRLIINKAKGV